MLSFFSAVRCLQCFGGYLSFVLSLLRDNVMQAVASMTCDTTYDFE